jgi:hypothetical protein
MSANDTISNFITYQSLMEYMEPLSRRSLLRASASTVAAGATVALAGCASSDDDGNGDGGGTTTPTGNQLTDIVEIVSHEWRGRSILEATVRNRTDTTIGTLQIDVNVYADEERISNGYGTITDLPGGTEDTVRVSNMSDFSAAPCDAATTYELVPNFYLENQQYEKRMEFEYDPEFCEG